MRIRLVLLTLMVWFILSCTAPWAFAENVLVFGNEYKPPKVYLENGKPKGILIDILRFIENETNLQFDIRLLPWARAYLYAEKGNGGIIGLSKTQERSMIFDYSEAIFYDDIMIVVLKGNEFHFESVKDLSGKRIGVRRGASYGDTFERGKKGIFKISEDTTGIQRLKKLLLKRIDAALIGPGKIGVYRTIHSDSTLQKNKDKFIILPHPFQRDPNYIGFSKQMNMSETLQTIDQVLKRGFEDGTIPQIINNHSKQLEGSKKEKQSH